MIAGIGLDLVQASRMEKLPDAVRVRIFSPAELAHAGGRASSLAGIYAAKEAFVKATGAPLLTVLREAHVVTEASGAPKIELSGMLAERFEGFSFFLSISHDAGFSAAVVVAEGKTEHPVTRGFRSS